MTRQTALKSLVVAAALAASALLAGAPAEAGGGTRLNFGGPLGTFVATPTPGYGGGASRAAPRKALPKTRLAKQPAVQHPARPPAKIVRARPPVTPTVADAGSKSAPKAATERPVKVTHTITAAELPHPTTASDPASSDPAATVAATDTSNENAGTADEAPPAATPAVPVETGPVGCRKFIPSVGVTVTVSCD